MYESLLPSQLDQLHGPTVPGPSREHQTRSLTTQMAQGDPDLLGPVLQNVLQEQPRTPATFLANTTIQGIRHPNPSPMHSFGGAFPQVGNVPHPLSLPQPAGTSTTGENTASGFGLGADLTRFHFITVIPASRDYDAVVASRLRRADRDGKSYKDALHEMHGVRLEPGKCGLYTA